MDKETLIAEYETLRRRERELVEQLNAVDARLIELEGELPNSYTFPGDPPLQLENEATQIIASDPAINPTPPI